MADLHEALKALSPIAWSDVPQDSLAGFFSQSFTAGELICNTLPPLPDGTSFEDSTPHYEEPNLANSSSEIHASDARSYPAHESHEALQKGWGKPVSIKAKDNPLNCSIYKMAGKDRHGAWFGRKSVHEGIGFDKFKRAMQREFPQSLTVSGGAGAGAVRGLAADRRLEKLEVEGVGRMEVYELSAQFPGPTTARDFLTVVMTTEDALSEKSATQTERGSTHVPRHFMIVSRPLQHPDAPERSGYVRGQYESVEMIREIPLHQKKAPAGNAAKTSGKGESKDKEASKEEPPEAELNPVEWVMVTRSDPGGGIPRFLVDRGTPEAMLGDLKKFFDWACPMDEIPAPDADMDKQEQASKQETADTVDGPSTSQTPATSAQSTTSSPPPYNAEKHGGILSGIGNTLHAGLEAIAPVAVTKQVDHYLYSGAQHEGTDSDDSDDTSEADSFMSANELHRLATAPEEMSPRPSDSLDNISLASNSSDLKDKKDMNSHEKEVLKLVQKRESLDRKLARKRADEEAKLQKAKEKDQTDVEKAQEKLDKEMKRTEEKHRKELEKLEQRRARELRKAEEKRRKKDDASTLSRVSRERDEFRGQAELYRRENALLAGQVQELQAEVMALTQRLAKLEGGNEALRGVVQDEVEKGGHRRGMSTVSVQSGASARPGSVRSVEK